MGANCSCVNGLTSEDEVYMDPSNGQVTRIIAKDVVTSNEKKSDELLPITQEEEHPRTSPLTYISDLMTLQNILRGFHDRRRSKIYVQKHLSTNFDRKYLSGIPEELNEITEYSIKKMTEFVYDEINDSIPVTKKEQLEMPDGSLYTGEWNIRQQRHGKGKQTWLDGSAYEGHWQNDKMHGKGRLVNSKGDIYDGNWAKGKKDGFGKLILIQEGSVYEGEWVKDKKDGFGSEQWKDGSSYLGFYKDGLKHGHGLLKWDDGRVYEGDWHEEKMHGQGTFTWKDDRKYTGSYVNDLKEGYGCFTWPDGRKYEGYWLEGKQHGLGVYCTQAGNVREGEWKNGKRIRWVNNSV